MLDSNTIEDRFNRSCRDAVSYPANLVFPHAYDHQLSKYVSQLDTEENELFCIESKTSIDFVELNRVGESYQNETIHTYSGLDTQLRLLSDKHDPICRYVFVYAESNRGKLKTDREMLMRILTYHQVMPSFLDFVLSFGKQEQPKDFYFSAVRSEVNFGMTADRLLLSNNNRSGEELRLCYNLRSVESAEAQRQWPWSIRQCAVYHSFDITYEVPTWIMLKANKVIRNRLNSLVNTQGISGSDALGSDQPAFDSTLASHLVVCSWAAENWRWYTNYLEERFQDGSRSALTEAMDLASLKREMSSSGYARSGGYAIDEKTKAPISSFDQLQDLHFYEEKTNEALLVTKGNVSVLDGIHKFYEQALEAMNPDLTHTTTRRTLAAQFYREIENLKKEFMVHQTRIEMLLRLIANRRNLLESTIQHRSTQMSYLLAEKSQISAENMEQMTKAMHTIAQSTKIETVSMRIITLVTLVYLPGTFVSTLMSTQIVTFRPGDFSKASRYINPEALALFLEISVPLLLFTIALWWVFKKRENRIALRMS